MNNFFVSTLKSLSQTGTVAPSSKYLIKEILQRITFEPNQILIEFGTGNGCITDALISRMDSSSILYSLEINNEFYRYSKKKYAAYPNVRILNLNATNFDEILENREVDYFISSLPLAIIPNRVTEQIIQKAHQNIKPTGRYIQYQYSLNKFSYLKKQFKKVELDFTIRNFPPAFIYSCH